MSDQQDSGHVDSDPSAMTRRKQSIIGLEARQT